MPDPKGGKQKITLFLIGTDGGVGIGWTTMQLESLGLPTKLSLEYAKAIAALFPGVTLDSKNPDSLSRDLTAAEIDQAFDRFTATVSRFVEQVKKASVGR